MDNLKMQIKYDEDDLKEIVEEIEDTDNELIEKIKDEQLSDLIKMKLNSYDNSIILGKLYFKIFNILKEISDFLKPSDNIYNYVTGLELDKDFIENIENYNNNNFGSYFSGERIKMYVNEKRQEINTLITLFFQIFKEE